MTLSPNIALISALTCTMLSSSANPLESKNWREVASGTQSSIEEKTQQIIQTQEEWQKWWNKHSKTQSQPENAESQKPPKVDFDKETVLIVTMGMRSTGGHAIHFSDIRHEGKSLKVVVTTTSPARDAMVTMALTYPFAAIAIPKHSDSIEFVLQQN